MYSHIYIDGDATVWTLGSPVSAEQISESGEALALTVTSPLKGTLLLSPNAARVSLFPDESSPMQPMGWIPGDENLNFPCLYLPSVSIPPAGGPVLYRLSESTLAQVQQDLAAAMSGGTKTTVSFSYGGNEGEVVINGPALPFAVISPGG